MPISITDHFKISKKAYKATGAFDAILDVDTRLFIDPFLLEGSKALPGAFDRLQKHFENILLLLKQSKVKGDKFWREADKLMRFPEVEGLCIGYSKEGTAGAGSGPQIRAHLLGTAKEIIDAGVKEPSIFHLAGLFEENVGPDRISDMTARIIAEDLRDYTRHTFLGLGVMKKPDDPFPVNPFNGKPIILVPRNVLRDLPIAMDWDSIDIIKYENEKLRDDLNEQIGTTWKQAASRAAKADLREAIIKHPELLADLLDQYKKRHPEGYDFEDDPAGQVLWYDLGKSIAKNQPMGLVMPPKPTIDDVHKVVCTICDKFAGLIEDNGWWKFLYDKHGQPKHEEAAQLLFYGVADAYCEANDLGLNRESNAGRGPVDFKFNKGYQLSVVVEAKLTRNPKLLSGYTSQLPIYKKAEKAKRGIYLVIDNGAKEKKLEAFDKLVKGTKDTSLEVRYVDGNPKPSASKAA